MFYDQRNMVHKTNLHIVGTFGERKPRFIAEVEAFCFF